MEVNNRFRLADFYVMVTFEDMFIHVCDKVCVYVHVQRGQSVVKRFANCTVQTSQAE